MTEDDAIAPLFTAEQELQQQARLLESLRSAMKQVMPERGVWYGSTKFYPPECLKVLCCFPGTDLFWIDYVRNMGDRGGIRWVREDVLYDKTDADRNPFSWQLPILPDS